MNQNENMTGSEKKEISGNWVLLLFVGLLIGVVILGWLTG